MDDYVEVRGVIPEALENGLAESLSDLSVLGVQIEAYKPDFINVSIWAREGDRRTIERIQTVLGSLGSGTSECSVRTAEDWSARWRANLAAFEVGHRWWIDPHPDQKGEVPGDRFRLAVVPQAAFGSGTHESTQLVLMHLENLDCVRLRILDVGTGSGVLAVAADRLGAAPVVALDNDPIAAWEARTTAGRQSWSCAPSIVAGSVGCLGDAVFDLVLCNMIMTEFKQILGGMRRVLSPEGSVILSGILESEQDSVEAMLGKWDLVVVDVKKLGGWTSLRAARSAAP